MGGGGISLPTNILYANVWSSKKHLNFLYFFVIYFFIIYFFIIYVIFSGKLMLLLLRLIDTLWNYHVALTAEFSPVKLKLWKSRCSSCPDAHSFMNNPLVIRIHYDVTHIHVRRQSFNQSHQEPVTTQWSCGKALTAIGHRAKAQTYVKSLRCSPQTVIGLERWGTRMWPDCLKMRPPSWQLSRHFGSVPPHILFA